MILTHLINNLIISVLIIFNKHCYLKMIKEKTKLKLYQAYRQYIEFLNEQRISQPFSSILIAMPTIILLGDLLYNVSPKDSFINELTYLGASTAIMEILKSNTTATYLVSVTIICLLMYPLLAIIMIVLTPKLEEQRYSNGQFKKKYQKSFINCTLRVYASIFIYFFLPLFVSLGIKFSQLGTIQAILGSTILVLVFINCVIIQYHTFEFVDTNKTNELIASNYPYRLVDDFIIIFAIIIVNTTSSVARQFFGLGLIFLRFIISIYFPFYFGKNQYLHQMVLVASMICSFGLFFAQFDQQQYYLFLIVITFLIVLLAFTKIKREEQNWQQVHQNEVQNNDDLSAIRARLFKQCRYVKVYRELVILSRKNISHRSQLQIQILKSKCNDLQMLKRGGIKKCSSENVIDFEQSMILFLDNFIKASQLSISIFKFMQQRQGRRQILSQNINTLIKYLIENKIILRKMLQLNQFSPQSLVLLVQIYGKFYQDNQFIKEIQRWNHQLKAITSQRQIKKRYFSDKTTIVFINVLEEIGKIIKVSKNLPEVLGFIPTNLIGLSINQIIPFSIKPFHDENIISFMEKYSDKQKDNHFDLQFYAYNSEFHLQQVRIHLSWVMTDFHSFQMAGIIQKIESDVNVILTDEFGYLEGWTKKIGNEQFNFDQLSIAQRKKFNIMPLFPTLVKYMDSLGVYARTLFFKNQKTRDPNLAIVDEYKHKSISNFQNKLSSTFRKMLKQEEFVGACFAQIELTKLSLCRGQAKMLRFIIKQYDRIQNFSEITSLIESVSFATNTTKTDKSITQFTAENIENEQKQQMSIFSEEQKIDKKIDSNFTVQQQGPHVFSFEQLVFGQFTSSRTSLLQIGNIYRNNSTKRNEKEQKDSNMPTQTSFNPVFQKSNILFVWVLLVTLAFLILVIVNIVEVTNTSTHMQSKCDSVIKRNQAASIYLKTIFNPNITYVGRFVNGQLIQNQDYLFTQYINYTTFLGDKILQNKYYLFNTQIPATLQRLLQNPINYNNSTVSIIPPTNAFYYQQITYNYNLIVLQHHKKFNTALNEWSQTISTVRSNFYIRLAFLCICSLIYVILMILLYIREVKHKQALQAFFKFQKEDLQKKIGTIMQIVKHVQCQAAEWHLLKEFTQIVKRQDITNLEFNLIKNLFQVKIKFDHDPQTEERLVKKKFYLTIIVIILFMIAQIIFLVFHSVINVSALDYYKQTPYDLDSSAKLIVLPNYLLADLYLPLPTNIKDQYFSSVQTALGFPVSSVPSLYNLLSTPPCPSCNFMYPVLTTNYKSFYSTFKQRVTQAKNSNSLNSTDVSDLFYAADYVIQNILRVLKAAPYNYFDSSIVAYLIALGILCTAIYWGSKSISEQVEKLQLFLKFFSEQMITKNKHIYRLFSNTT